MAEPSAPQPIRPSQRSRKGTKAWRKNIDISEIEAGLEERREEIIQGGIISERPSEQLFLTDTTGAADVKKDYLRKHKPLKADEILARRSAVPALQGRKRPADCMVTDGILASKTKRPTISHKHYERLRKIAYGGETVRKDVVKSGEDANHDPWAEEQANEQPQFSFLEKKKPIREPGTLKHAPISQLKSGKAVPAVAKPSGGKSYNPDFQEWYDLLQREGAKEVQAEQARLAEAQREAEKQALIEKAQREAEVEEAQQRESGWESEWESEWEGIQSEPNPEWLNKKKPKRKTQAERNKIQRRKEQERRLKHEAKIRAKERQVAEAEALAKAVEEQERLRQLRLRQAVDEEIGSESDEGEEQLRRRKFSKAPIPDVPLELVLPDELQDSLRRLKPEGNLLSERYRNMLLRGKMESRRRIAQHKKRKVYSVEKYAYKDWKLK